MPQPHLHLFHCDFVLDKQAGAGVAEVMVANRAKTILQEHFAENPCHIVRGHKMTHIIHADVVLIFLAVAAAAKFHLLVLAFLGFQ